MSISAPKLLAGAGATVTSMLVGSFFGDSGTVYGAAIGSVTYSVAAEGYEYVTAKAHAKAHAAYLKRKSMMKPLAEGPPLPGGLIDRVLAKPGGKEALEQARVRRDEEEKKYDRKIKNGRKPLLLAGSALAISAVGIGVAYGIVGITEASTGKTFASNFPGQQTSYGSSFGSVSSTPPARVAPTVAPSGSVAPSQSFVGPSGSLTPSVTVSPTMVPTVVPSPTITQVPITPSQAAASPQAVPSSTN